MSGADSLDYRPDVDGLRAIAVLAVVVFHAFPQWLPGGFIGVDVFFVISGFLISSIILKAHAKGTFSYADFYARRIRRIFPALVLVLASCLVFGWLVLTPDYYVELGRHAVAGSLFVANLALWREAGYFDHDAQLKPLMHLWSLGVEEQFYLVWPLFLARFRSARALLVVIGLSFAANVLLVSAKPDAAFFLPVTRFWELASGALLAWASLGRHGGSSITTARSRTLRDSVSCLGLLLILAPAIGLKASMSFPGWWAAFPVAGAVALIASGPDGLVNRQLLALKPMVLIGLISYPLYLWHWPILVGLRVMDLSWLPQQSRAVKAGALALAFLLAYLTYVVLERRVRHARGAVPALCTAAAGILVASSGVLLSSGAPTRFSELQNQIVRAASRATAEHDRDYRSSRCFLTDTQTEADFSQECVPPEATGASSVLLWGDSHAAHLYQGLRALVAKPGLKLAQFSASRCPPLLAYQGAGLHAHCASINQHVLQFVEQQRPHTLVLAANWHLYATTSTDPTGSLRTTLKTLQGLGIPQVVVVGPVSSYPRPQSELLIRQTKGGTVPERLPTPRFKDLVKLDQALRRISVDAGVEFVSLLDALCTANGCLVAPAGDPQLLLSFDGAHLTRSGSQFVAEHALCSIFSACADRALPRSGI